MYDHNKGKRMKPHVVKTCENCGKQFEVEPYRALTAKRCSRLCHNKAVSVATADARRLKLLNTGACVSYRKLHGRHEHRVIAEQMLGRPLRSDEIVHHKDLNKRNNSPENLEIVKQSDHVRGHIPMMLECRKMAAGY